MIDNPFVPHESFIVFVHSTPACCEACAATPDVQVFRPHAGPRARLFGSLLTRREYTELAYRVSDLSHKLNEPMVAKKPAASPWDRQRQALRERLRLKR